MKLNYATIHSVGMDGMDLIVDSAVNKHKKSINTKRVTFVSKKSMQLSVVFLTAFAFAQNVTPTATVTATPTPTATWAPRGQSSPVAVVPVYSPSTGSGTSDSTPKTQGSQSGAVKIVSEVVVGLSAVVAALL